MCLCTLEHQCELMHYIKIDITDIIILLSSSLLYHHYCQQYHYSIIIIITMRHIYSFEHCLTEIPITLYRLFSPQPWPVITWEWTCTVPACGAAGPRGASGGRGASTCCCRGAVAVVAAVVAHVRRCIVRVWGVGWCTTLRTRGT